MRVLLLILFVILAPVRPAFGLPAVCAIEIAAARGWAVDRTEIATALAPNGVLSVLVSGREVLFWEDRMERIGGRDYPLPRLGDAWTLPAPLRGVTLLPAGLTPGDARGYLAGITDEGRPLLFATHGSEPTGLPGLPGGAATRAVSFRTGKNPKLLAVTDGALYAIDPLSPRDWTRVADLPFESPDYLVAAGNATVVAREDGHASVFENGKWHPLAKQPWIRDVAAFSDGETTDIFVLGADRAIVHCTPVDGCASWGLALPEGVVPVALTAAAATLSRPISEEWAGGFFSIATGTGGERRYRRVLVLGSDGAIHTPWTLGSAVGERLFASDEPEVRVPGAFVAEDALLLGMVAGVPETPTELRLYFERVAQMPDPDLGRWLLHRRLKRLRYRRFVDIAPEIVEYVSLPPEQTVVLLELVGERTREKLLKFHPDLFSSTHAAFEIRQVADQLRRPMKEVLAELADTEYGASRELLTRVAVAMKASLRPGVFEGQFYLALEKDPKIEELSFAEAILAYYRRNDPFWDA